MASFPGAKVHRESRRKLGRGQSVQQTPVTITATASTVTVTYTLNRPCVINGMVPTVTSNGALSSQHVTSPTQFEQVFTLTQAAATISASPQTADRSKPFKEGGTQRSPRPFNMDWQPTTNNPLGIYFDTGPVVVGVDTDGGGGQNLQVTGATSLDGGLILTDGNGNLMTTDGGEIVATDADQDATCTLVSLGGIPQLSLISHIAAGAQPATIGLVAAQRPPHHARHRRRQHKGGRVHLPRQRV